MSEGRCVWRERDAADRRVWHVFGPPVYQQHLGSSEFGGD